MRKLAYTWATWFGTGYSPFAPGTVGSLAAIPVVWYLALCGKLFLGIFAVVAMFSGVWVSNIVSNNLGADDPQIVVIDEVLGMAIALLLVPAELLSFGSASGWIIIIFSFLSFRFFDVWKPWPASYFDEEMHNGWGMMLDDLAAGIFSMLFTYFFITLVYDY